MNFCIIHTNLLQESEGGNQIHASAATNKEKANRRKQNDDEEEMSAGPAADSEQYHAYPP
jgi:hypothetical protein